MKYLKSSKDFQDEVENYCNKKIKKVYDWIIKKDVWVTSLAKHLRFEESFHGFAFPKTP